MASYLMTRRCPPTATAMLLGMVFVSSTVFGGIAFGGEGSEGEGTSLIGRHVANFTLKDYRGRQYTLDEFADAKLVVLAVLGTECPLAKLYGPRLAEMADEYESQKVAFIGLDPNRQDSVTEIGAFCRRAGIKFPVLKDLGNKVADALGARRTPELFVLDESRTIRYHGRVDDQYGFQSGVGYQQPEPSRRDLALALNDLLAGKAVRQASTPTRGCLIGRVRTPDANAKVTYSNQIARLFQRRCVECHREGQIAPFALDRYDDVVGWADMIAEVVHQRRMPPWHADPRYGHFVNDYSLTDQEQRLIDDWVAAGAPEGDVADLPEPMQYAEGWMMPEVPDMIIPMADEPFDVPADGVVDYQYFVVDPGFTEDKWVKVAECMPDNRAVVHHIIVFIRSPHNKNRSHASHDERAFAFLSGFAPGTRPVVWPDGMAKKIPAGSKLIFQMHYTPIGSAQKDRSRVGLKFVDDPSTIKYQVATTAAANHRFEIPAGDPDHVVRATDEFPRDTLVLSLFPHMHLRGKAFRYEAIYPDGTREVLLNVPRYDFNWQNSFIFTQPKLFPKGTKLYCEAHFDNSADNLANPDPSIPVRWGDQTWEEMMIGWYDMALPVSKVNAILGGKQKAGKRQPSIGKSSGQAGQ